MSKKIVITDYNYADLDQEKKVFESLDVELCDYQCRTEDDVIAVAKDADAVIVQFVPMTRRVLSELKNCKAIIRYAVGVDNIDLEAATELGIRVVNVPDYGIEEVSDHTVLLLLAIARKLCFVNNAVKEGVWDFKITKPIFRLKGKTVGLIGFGRIPRLVAEKLKGFGFEILVSDPFISEEIVKEHNALLATFDEVMENADFICLHVPLSEKTKHMVNANVFAKMKKKPYVINTGRGGLVDETALLKALEAGQIQGAALDVSETEPMPKGHPLFGRDDVILTPHYAWYSEDAGLTLQRYAAEEVARVLTGQEPKNVVNKEVQQLDSLRSL